MLSKTSRYGVRAALYIAAHTDEKTLLGIKELSENIEINTPMLSKVLQFMTKRALITSKKGRNGGFYMTEVQKNRHLMYIIKELEQSEAIITACMLGQKHCDTCNKCPYHEMVASIRSELQAIYNTDSIVETALKLKNAL
jgi:Rrf2 family iron-sulfur cluster assembly transcriptional regulator